MVSRNSVEVALSEIIPCRCRPVPAAEPGIRVNGTPSDLERSPAAQLDVAVHRLELDAGPARAADVGTDVFRVEASADGHREIRVQRPVDRLQVHVPAEIAGEF